MTSFPISQNKWPRGWLLGSAPCGAEAESRRLARQVQLLQRITAGFTLAMAASTWRLWTPQFVFPQVPLLRLARSAPDLLQWWLAALAGAGLAVMLLVPSSAVLQSRVAADSPNIRAEPGNPRLRQLSHVGIWMFIAAAVLLFTIDQHRLQPWAYQAVLVAIALVAIPPDRALPRLRLLTVSIYLFSAASKCDYTFLHSLGPRFSEALWGLAGMQPNNWPPAIQLAAAVLFPLGELIVAGLLSFRRTARFGVSAAVVMHAGLLLVLGPWGLNHLPAVLLWNVLFFLQVMILFGKGRSADEDSKTENLTPASSPISNSRRLRGSRLAEGVLLAAVLLPLAEPWGWWDHWLSWQLYAPGSSRVLVYVRTSDVRQFWGSAHDYLHQDEPFSPWTQVQLDRWSLEVLNAPIYPQARFQLGAALKIGTERPLRVELFSAASRWTGARQQTTLHDFPQVSAAADMYWLNAYPGEE